MTTHQNNFTQVLYSMNHKSIISLISFFLVTMFYVAPARAGWLTLNVEVPKECGAWAAVNVQQHCFVPGPSRGKGGKHISFECRADTSRGGPGRAVLETDNCGIIVFITDIKGSPEARKYYSAPYLGNVHGAHISKRKYIQSNTHNYKVCKPDDRCHSND